ncbi:MAG: DUF3300 domain-containing protein [Lentisphaerota bacterium]
MRSIALIVLFFSIAPFLAAQEQPPTAAGETQPQFSQSQLEQLAAPIALYPDDLLAQVLAASTYPADIVAAARFLKRNPGLDQDEIKTQITDMEWDPSVKGLMFFPELLLKMNDNMDWTKDLGDAFLEQQKDVMDTIQVMRMKAKNAGTLQSNANQDVTTNTAGQIEIQSTDPATMYPQDYTPSTAYGSDWGYSNCYYPAVIAVPAWPYRGGYACAWALGYRCGWNNGGLQYNNNYYHGDFYRNNISNAIMNPENRNWAHDGADARALSSNAQQLARQSVAAGRPAQNFNQNGLAAANAAGNNLQAGDRTQAARSALQNADRSQAASQRVQNSQYSAQNYSRQNANPAMSGSRNADLERSYSNRGARSRSVSAQTNNRSGSYQSYAGSASRSTAGGGRGGGGGRR